MRLPQEYQLHIQPNLTYQPTKQTFFLMGLFYGLTPVHNQKAKLSTRSGWMDELGFYVPSTVFQSFRDDGRVNMKGCAMKRRLGTGRISQPDLVDAQNTNYLA